MILCDTGFIVGLIRATDRYYPRCIETMKTIRAQLITTWPCITEAMYLVGAGTGQESLRSMIETQFLHLTEPSFENAQRACELMRQYEDAPMDFADASLVVAAETLNVSQILTFDRHFHAYLINGKTAFDVIM